MYKEIGSNFWLNRYEELESKEILLDYPGVNIADAAFLSTGRSAISFILEHIKLPENKKVALLPSFTCHTVIEPFINAGYQVFYYRIDKSLTCSSKSFLADLKKHQPSVVLMHGYFGFNTLETIKDCIPEVKNEGVVVIEDITQTLYSLFDHLQADYYICSFRKWMALPDGGCAISANKPFSYKPKNIDRKLLTAKLAAFHAKHLYMEEAMGAKEDFLRMFQDAEQILCEQEMLFAMSATSKKIQGNLDVDVLRRRRRENFQRLADGLADIGLVQIVFSRLPDDVTPLYFPFYTRCSRKTLQGYLAGNDIYAPIIWPMPAQCENAVVCEEVNWVYKHILALPCDQRYSNDDMQRIIKTISTMRLSEVREEIIIG